MAVRIVREDGDEILRKKSREVETVDDKIRNLLDDMVDTMHKYNGVGLSAVQVGILKRVIVIDTYEEDTPIVKLINPKIVKQKGSREVEEGCLSFPNKFAKVIRPTEVVVEGLNENGEKETPVVIHRAILGSIDRFIALLLEETKGALPLWLAPVSINVIPVNNEYHLEYAKEVFAKLNEAGFRAELDERNEKLSYKMRESQTKKIPFTLVLGDKEKDSKTITYRIHGSNESITMDLDEFISKVKENVKNKTISYEL